MKRLLLLVAASIGLMAAPVSYATPGPHLDCQGHNGGEIHDAFIRNGYDCTEVPDTSVIGNSYNHYEKHVFGGCGAGRQKVYESNIKLVDDQFGVHPMIFGSRHYCWP